MMQQSKKAVLVIDDDPVWRKLYEDILRGEFALVSASSEEDAGQKIAAQDPPFHVVVTDVRLKDWEKENRGGLNVIFQNIRVKGDYTNTIVITGYDTEDTAFQAKEFLQAYAYLLKTPDVAAFDYKQFRKLVREAAATIRPEFPQHLARGRGKLPLELVVRELESARFLS